jgi:catechol 2,3-dioxygenase-like lactoylglutathione lyase family enzyme
LKAFQGREAALLAPSGETTIHGLFRANLAIHGRESLNAIHQEMEQPMITRLARVTIYVHNQNDALRFYTETLGLEKRSDVTFGPGARWLTVAPAGQTDFEILLQEPVPAMHGEDFAQKIHERVGQGTTWVFFSDDCRADYETLKGRGVTFSSAPQEQLYGVEAVFQDLYGNSFSLLQPAPVPEAPAN